MNGAVTTIHGLDHLSIPDEVFTAAEPVVLKGLVAAWPAVTAANQGAESILQYLRKRARDQDVLAFQGAREMRGRYFYKPDLSGFNFDKMTLRLEALLDRFAAWQEGGNDPYAYLGSTAVEEVFPGFRLENDIALAPERPLVSVWMGTPSRIAAHFDVPDNIACVVAGKRRFTLFPPEQLANLYVGPLDFTPAGQAVSLVDFAAPDYNAFPRFEQALEASLTAELEPGDALYVPSMWWHHVEALEPFNVLINYWWNSAHRASGNPLNVLIHALLSIKGLPPEQRRVWADIFDHYVFSGEEVDFSHIPAARLGVLGAIDETTAKQLRAMLRNKLGNP